MVESDSDEITATKTGAFTVTRYAAPELIKYNDGRVTRYSDTFSFAMLMLECITEAPPFSDIRDDFAVMHARIAKQQTPARPDGKAHVPDDLWDLMNRCWSTEPDQRPSMEGVFLFFLERA